MSSQKGFPVSNGAWTQAGAPIAPQNNPQFGQQRGQNGGQQGGVPGSAPTAQDGGSRHQPYAQAPGPDFGGFAGHPLNGGQSQPAGQNYGEPSWGDAARAALQPRQANWDASNAGAYAGQPYPSSSQTYPPQTYLPQSQAAQLNAAGQPRPAYPQGAASPYGAAEGYAPQFQANAPLSANLPMSNVPPSQRSQPAQGYGNSQAAGGPSLGAAATPYGAQIGTQYGNQYDAQQYPTAQQTASRAAAAAQSGFGQYQAPVTPHGAGAWTGQPADSRGLGYAQAAPATASGVSFAGYSNPDAAASRTQWQQPASQSYGADTYQQPVDDLGFGQPAGGELDPAYGEDDQDYEYEEAPRGRRPFFIAAALAGAIMVGGGLAFGYKTLVGNSGSGSPPIIKSAEQPSKTKPADAGGKQFAHSDSKIMGRLGDGSAAVAAGGAAGASEAAAADSDSDASGTRKVATLVVGRDGSIQAPVMTSSGPAVPTGDVPGLTVVDAFAGQGGPASGSATSETSASSASSSSPPLTAQTAVAVISEPSAAPSAPVSAPQATGSVNDALDPDVAPPKASAAAVKPPAKPAAKKVAALAPAGVSDAYNPAGGSSAATAAPAATVSSGGANGYVAVLASVPRSSSSRMDALKRFADMQQKYSSALTGKTPDVAEANLGAKGAYHRLVVGPPASREQASALCSQLKAQGHTDCWVTAY